VSLGPLVPDDQRIGRAAGMTCATSATADVVDAIVIRHQAPIVTTEPRRPSPHRRLHRRQNPSLPNLTSASSRQVPSAADPHLMY
jgi:hypothetical protein